ncbi:MAG: HAD-IIB family hydrolase [Ruminococcaceae bacterium]|nr:HAD-IIB family hydrolase [Oscillospiraceae bacterium]
MIKLIASDLDKTLMQRTESCLSSTVESDIKAALNRGVQFAVVSGRDYPSLKRVFASVADRIYFVGCCGALCVKGGKLLSSHPVSADHVLQALHVAGAMKKNLVLCGIEKVYVYGSDAFKQKVRGLYGDDAVTENVLPSRIKENIYKLSFYSYDTENTPSGFDVTPFGLRIFYQKNGWCEYINRFAGKGEALQDLQFRLGVTKAETVGAGDELDNDYGLLIHSGVAFAATPDLASATGATLFTDPHVIFGREDTVAF